ncbi:MAG: adenylate/guanylate cyclase domain-containing protein [Candidatus Kapaibacterium sp.]
MTHEDSTTKVEVLEALIESRDYKLAETAARELLVLFPAEDERKNELHCRVLLALCESCWRQGLGREVLPMANTVLTLAEQLGNKRLEAKALNSLGNISSNLSENSAALEYFYRGLAASEESGNIATIAAQHGSIGNVYNTLSDYAKALEHYHHALARYTQINDKLGIALSTGNIGNVYGYQSDYSTALEYFFRALALNEEISNTRGIAQNTSNIAITYNYLGEYDKSLEFAGRALAICEQTGDKAQSANTTGSMGITYMWLADYPKALEYMSRALTLFEELGNKWGAARNIGNIALVYKELADYDIALEYYNRSLTMNQEIGDRRGVGLVLGSMGSVYKELRQYDKAMEYSQKALDISTEIGHKESTAVQLNNMGSLYAISADYVKALEYYNRGLALAEEIGNRRSVSIVIGCIGEIFAEERFEGYNPKEAESYLLKAAAMNEELGTKAQNIIVFEALAKLYEKEKRWEAMTYMRKFYDLKAEVRSEESKKQAHLLNQRRLAADREKQLEIERASAASERKILNNILPEEITTRLIKGEKPIADHFDNVSILFMDIVDFTPLASRITAQQLVHLLNAIFSAADGVMREFGLEKIKTIGDAYMAVAGAPIVQEDHAQRAAQAALKLMDVMENLVVVFPDNYGDKSWIETIPEIQVRIGLHCGPVAAGVVGENKFLYDLWGDAVNTASRMESHGEPGKIHCTEEFKHAVETLHAPSLQLHAPSLHFIRRGEMEIKGKGLMKTYFLQKATL